MTKFVTDLKNTLSEKAEKIEWKYFATSHGKGSVDGIGGRAKSLVREATKSKRGIVVHNSKDFATLVTELMPGVTVIHVSDEEIGRYVEENKLWDNVKNVNGIAKSHCIVCERDGCVKLFVDNDKTDMIACISYLEDHDDENKTVDMMNDQQKSNLKKEDWVVVTYDDKCYPGKITKIVGNSKQVSVMKSCFPTGWKWPTTPDEIFYKDENIIKQINPPVPANSRGAWVFKDSILNNY